MKHPDEVQLNAWADNALPEDGQAAVDMHLDQCPDCRQTAYALRGICDTMNSVTPAKFNSGLERTIIRAYRQEIKKTDGAVNGSSFFQRRWISAYSAIVAGIVAGLLLGYLINPLIATLSSDSQVMMTENEQNTRESDDLYLNRLIADNRIDLW